LKDAEIAERLQNAGPGGFHGGFFQGFHGTGSSGLPPALEYFYRLVARFEEEKEVYREHIRTLDRALHTRTSSQVSLLVQN
jgi:hypothetical protein